MAEFHPASNTAVATASEVPPASVNTEVQGSPVNPSNRSNSTKPCYPGLNEAFKILAELSPHPKITVEKRRAEKR